MGRALQENNIYNSPLGLLESPDKNDEEQKFNLK
jgi:hypothetical protein